MYYLALIEAGNGTFDITFPQFPGCVSQGDTLSNAIVQARNALALHVEGMQEDGEEVPNPDDSVAIDHDLKDTQQVQIPLITLLGQTERVNISIDKGRLRAIDAEAKRRGITRSAFLVESAMSHIV